MEFLCRSWSPFASDFLQTFSPEPFFYFSDLLSPLMFPFKQNIVYYCFHHASAVASMDQLLLLILEESGRSTGGPIEA